MKLFEKVDGVPVTEQVKQKSDTRNSIPGNFKLLLTQIPVTWVLCVLLAASHLFLVRVL